MNGEQPPRRGKFKPGARAEAERLAAGSHPGLAVRVAAAAVAADILGSGHALDDKFSGAALHSKLVGMDARDIALARSIVTVALRHLGAIRRALARLLEKGAPRNAGNLEWILVTAAAQILWLDVPDHAAVDLAVRATRLDAKSAPYAALVNGVLRNLARARDELTQGEALDADTPPWLAARWRKTYGEAAARAIAAAHATEPTLDLTVKSDPEGWARRLDGVALPTGSVRLRSRAPVAELEGYADGQWWVQDAAAALPARLLGATSGETVADLCAAPGGKTAQLAAAGARVTAVDRSAERLKRLAANLKRLDLEAEIVVADAKTWRAGPFDAVLVDAPCTATGTIRRHPDVAWTKKPSDIVALAATQAALLDRAAELVRPGGRIVYCTCSLEPEEGEQQIAALLRRNPDLSRLPARPEEIGGLAELITPDGDVRALPCHLPDADGRLAGMDGFFVSRLVRQG